MPSWITNFGNRSQGAVRIGDHASLADGEVIVIGSKTYEWDNNAAVTGSNVLVTIGANAAADITNLIAAINANKPAIPVTAHVDAVDTGVARIVGDSRSALHNQVFTTTMADADNVIAPTGGLLVGGENAGRRAVCRRAYVVTALDVLAGSLEIETGLQNVIDGLVLSCRTSTGLEKQLTSLVTVDGTSKRLKIDFDGATNPAAGDTIYVVAVE